MSRLALREQWVAAFNVVISTKGDFSDMITLTAPLTVQPIPTPPRAPTLGFGYEQNVDQIWEITWGFKLN